ncbi:ABC transporter ATP-binding protein [Actinotignum urinale]|uniref:ABC transporter ATP-binding protein n=1 Tax=Actinotignum urinale TaxID=190146 RepID=UPI000C7FA0F3|nr:ABC transporter ATP-binding protein [Actinotignum urinale]WIK59359.1 ABC transporter ATP-binding protein [Actinotignum urinale]
MIEARDIRHSYGDNLILDGIDITLPSHGMVALLGPNGSGKTTLLRALYGSLKASGAVLIDSVALNDIPRKELAKKLAVVVQESASELPMTVADVVALGRLPHKKLTQRSTKDDNAIIAKAIIHMGIEHLAERDYSQLSGGERQRTLIARALAQESKYILLDEPTNHLDIRYQHEVLHRVAELDGAAILVLHDLNLAARYCDTIVVMHNKKVLAVGTPHEVFTPEILEPVYGVNVTRNDYGDRVNLIFDRED